MSKRKNGEGSWGTKIIKGVNYKYYKKKYDGFDNMKYFYGLTESEVNEKRKAFETDFENQRLLATKNKTGIIFGEYIEAWLKQEKKREVSDGTYDGYERAIKTRIKNLKEYDLYNKQMQQIDENPDVAKRIFTAYVDALVEHGYALKTIKEVCELISQCLDYASDPIRKDLQYNYIKMVTLPRESNVKKKRKEIHFMTENEMETLYQEAKRVYPEGRNDAGKRLYGNNAYAIIILMYTGMRIGELAALKWKDVDLEKKTLFIHRSMRDIKNRNKKSKDDGLPSFIFIEKETKTKNGIRTLTITNRVMESLEYFLKFKKSDDDYVCVSNNHTNITRNGVARSLIRMTKRAGLHPYTPHELRHSFGSILLDKSDNVDRAIAAISRILGHANITVTYNIYIHILDSRLTTTFKMLDYEDMDKIENEDDLEIDNDNFVSIEESNNQIVESEQEDNTIDYKQKYEELLLSLQSLQALIPSINK